MGYKQNNPLPMMKSAMKMMKAERKAGMHRDSAMYMNSPMYSGHSPMERESRELKDMPIVDIEKGDAEGSPAKNMDHDKMGRKEKFNHMMVEHPAKRPDFTKKGEEGKKPGSPAKAAKPDYIDIDGDGNKEESMKEAAKDKKGSPANMKRGSKDEKSGEQPTKESFKPAEYDPKKRKEYFEKKKGSPNKKYDRVVLGGNKGDKSKTKPGKKDYEGKGSPAKMSEKRAEKLAKKGKGFISQKTGGKDTEKSFTKLSRKGRKEMKETGMVSSEHMKKSKKIK